MNTKKTWNTTGKGEEEEKEIKVKERKIEEGSEMLK
jgi:hypothetical protein